MEKRLVVCVLLLSFQFLNAAIIESVGWLETFYIKWNKETCAAKYNVYYRATGSSTWTKIDDQLVREYNDHFRADVLGLKAGTYEARVVLVNGGVEGTSMTATNIQVTAHERTGFAFMDGVVPGAYKADGTLKDNAQVLYVTEQNKNTISLAVKTASNGNTTASTGVGTIVKSLEKGYEDRPIVFRFIGKVTDVGMNFEDGGGDVNIKDNCKNNTNCYLTFEGVGNDATIYGFGFKTARAQNLEIRNLGIMLTNSTEGDNVGINTNSKYIWIHNNDMFYGNPGTDSDQVKGDGTTDIKASTNITVSYNHYWDNGKVHLLGNSSSETPGFITYHHNWYDHSDSRHPRARLHNAHVYNNYYDGVSTYGMGACMASSIFSERNYFRNTNRPMTISMQGSDDGTFSKEDGGMIKAFGNFLDANSKKKYTPWSSSNNVDFDAYEVSSATTTVPTTVKAKQGGATFNNNILSNYPAYTSQNDSAAIRTQVKKYAGRVAGGDFTFTFNNANDDGSKDVNTALKTQLQNYTSKLVKVQDAGTGGSVSCPVSSSSLVQSSSSSSVAESSSSSESTTPIINHLPLATSHSPTYYSLKGEPLGNVKPQKAGIYIFKQRYSIKKIVVR
jgi:pectate lyase